MTFSPHPNQVQLPTNGNQLTPSTHLTKERNDRSSRSWEGTGRGRSIRRLWERRRASGLGEVTNRRETKAASGLLASLGGTGRLGGLGGLGELANGEGDEVALLIVAAEQLGEVTEIGQLGGLGQVAQAGEAGTRGLGEVGGNREREEAALLGVGAAAKQLGQVTEVGELGGLGQIAQAGEAGARGLREVAQARKAGRKGERQVALLGVGAAKQLGQATEVRELGGLWEIAQAGETRARGLREVTETGKARRLGKIAQARKTGGHREQATLLLVAAEYLGKFTEVGKIGRLRKVAQDGGIGRLGEVTQVRKTRGLGEVGGLGVAEAGEGEETALVDMSGHSESTAHETHGSSTAELHFEKVVKERRKKAELLKNGRCE